jgi:pyruvate dehydrogenase E1 component beta subunit
MSNWGTTPPIGQLLEYGKRPLSYAQAIYEATLLALESDPSVHLFGEGATDPFGIYSTTKDLHKRFSQKRVFDMPISEGLITGLGIGMALMGLRPIVIHPRNDFLLLALDQLCNHAAKWRFMFGKSLEVPLVVRSVACRGWGSASQHAQALHSILAHFPGLNVLLPFTPYDAKGFLLWAVLKSSDPTIIMEHKWLWNLKGEVPEGRYFCKPASPRILREGKDVTLVGISYGVADALSGAQKLQEMGISAEVIDLRSLRPLKMDSIYESVKKTGRVVVIDTAHLGFGASGEIISRIFEKVSLGVFKGPPIRIGLPDSPIPAASEATYYYSSEDIKNIVAEVFYGRRKQWSYSLQVQQVT